MREYAEPSMKNLFRRPLVMGVPFSGLLALAFVVLVFMIFSNGSKTANTTICAIAAFGYLGLRICNRLMVEGWEDELFYPLEKMLWKVGEAPRVVFEKSDIQIISPDTLEKNDLILEKEKLVSIIESIEPKKNLVLYFNVDECGASVFVSRVNGHLVKNCTFNQIVQELEIFDCVYTLKTFPVTTTPLGVIQMLNRMNKPTRVFIRVTGLHFLDAKRKVEASRRRNAQDQSNIKNVDSEVTFEESSRVLEAMSRGEESIAEFSMVVLTQGKAFNIDESLFHLEKNRDLALFSVLGLRKNHFRSHLMRFVTISDLMPTFLDPKESSLSVLKTIRNNPLYFSPQDPRLEALHWLVIGATGTGKSFFTGALLKRLIERGAPMSVLFLDHNRSFRRMVRSSDSIYIEPQSLEEVEGGFFSITRAIDQVGAVTGIELSDLNFDEKKKAVHFLLSQIEHYLRNRNTIHPIYVVLDECWNFIRDEPILVQRAFREFRKLNGAVVAITQSLSDFMSDASGKSIVQNAPIRILLRQGEDPALYKGTLGLNDLEIQRARLLRQVKGEYSECIIKTSFLSRVARLYPTPEEYELFRTDNIREEMIRENKIKQKGAVTNA